MDSLFTIAREKGGAIAWTEEQVAYLKEKYTKDNVSLAELGRQFGLGYSTIRACLAKNGVKSQGNKRGFLRNSFYFNKIDSKEKAYWLGIMYADGSVSAQNNEIRLGLTDKEHVIKFQNAVQATNHKIIEIIDPRFEKAKPLYAFSIKDKQLHSDLIAWGCVPNKSLMLSDFPNIPYHYVPDFLRGYFDGDGSLHYLKGTNNWRICFTGTRAFLENIKNYLRLNVSCSSSNTRIYQLQISGRKQVERILNLLYESSTESTRLDRKYKSYLKCLEWAHRH